MRPDIGFRDFGISQVEHSGRKITTPYRIEELNSEAH
jgi:hypothetical protein